MRSRKTSRRASRKGNRHLAEKLATLERQLAAALQQRLARARSVSAHDPTEFMDMAADSELDDLAARLAESDSAKIEEIEDALTALREGSYGICRACGKKISARRLKAVPFATLCLSCKQKQEREQATGLDATFGPPREGAAADVGLGELDDAGENDVFPELESSEIF